MKAFPRLLTRTLPTRFGVRLLRRPLRSRGLQSCSSSSFSTSTTSTISTSGDLVGWTVQPIPGSNGDRLVGTITLQSPQTFNALTVEMGREFQALCRTLVDDITSTPGSSHANNNNNNNNKVDAVVVTGQGDQAFSAGGDLDWLQSLRHNSVHANADLMMQFYHSFLCIRTLPVPVIAALQGPAMGAGAGLALACDLRTAQTNTPKLLGLHFSRLGIHTGMGGSFLLPQALNAGNAILNEILLSGKILSGEECFALGLVNSLEEDAKQAAYNLAAKVTLKQHPVAIRSMLQTIRQRQDVGLEQALQREAMAQAACYAREDWGEGVTAIAEKRDPNFDPYHSK